MRSENDTVVWVFNDYFQTDVGRVFESLSHFLSGESCARLPSWMPSFICRHRGETLLYNSYPGTVPFYIARTDDAVWIASRVKYLHQIPVRIELRPEKFIRDLQYGSEIPEQSVFRDIRRLRLGELMRIGKDGEQEFTFPEVSRKTWNQTKNDEAAWVERLFQCLDKHCRTQNDEVSLALSGGYDSGSIAGILGRQGVSAHAITTGSAPVNEFSEAGQICRAYGHRHHLLPIDEERWLKLYLEAIYLNEINHIIIAEAFPGIYLSCEMAAGLAPVLYTGYGADILLGNLLHADTPDINRAAVRILQRTALSGELSSGIPDRLGVEVLPVYLSREIMDICLAMPPGLKVKGGINKYIQRNMIENFSLMPPELLETKKKGLDEGAGIPGVMNRLLGLEDECAEARLTARHHFFYSCLRELFEQNIEPGSCDLDRLVHSAIETV